MCFVCETLCHILYQHKDSERYSRTKEEDLSVVCKLFQSLVQSYSQQEEKYRVRQLQKN